MSETLMAKLGVILALSFLFIKVQSSESNRFFDGFAYPEEYIIPGDINVGVLFSAKNVDKQRKKCVIDLHDRSYWQLIEANTMALEDINKDPNILPGVNLGLTLLEGCANNPFFAHQANRFKAANDGPRDQFNVAAVILATYSSTAIYMANVLHSKHIPQIGVATTSDKLSKKFMFPSFFRVVPGDRVQMKIVLNFIKHQNWTYISVVYGAGDYGLSAKRAIQDSLEEYGICVANWIDVNIKQDKREFDKKMRKLISDQDRARVVFVVSPIDEFIKLLESARNFKSKSLKKFIWIAADDIDVFVSTSINHELREYMNGMFTSTFSAPKFPQLLKRLSKLTPTSTNNILFNTTWEMLFNCSLSKDKGCIKHKDITKSKDFAFSALTSRSYDAVWVVAKALELTRRKHCTQSSSSEIANCIATNSLHMSTTRCRIQNKVDMCNLSRMQKYLMEVSFRGVTGMVHFDENGELNSAYDIFQNLPSGQKTVRTILLKPTGKVQIDNVNNITWEYIDPPHHSRPNRFSVNSSTPQSACIICCKTDQIINTGALTIDAKEPSCCQLSNLCKSELSINEDEEYCESCGAFEWPSESSNFTECAILPDHLDNAFAVIIFLLSAIGILVSIVIIAITIVYVESITVTLWSRELSFIAILSMLIGFVNNMILFAPHTKIFCTIELLFRTIATTGLYGSLLFKTLRIYRVFNASVLSERPKRFVSPISQVFLTLAAVVVLFIFQIFMTDLDNIAMRNQDYGANHLHCNYGWPADIAYHFVNMVLILVSIFLAYQNRDLPERFQEPHQTWLFFFIATFIWYSYELLIRYFILDKDVFIILLAVMRLIYFSSALFFLFYFRMRDLHTHVQRSKNKGSQTKQLMQNE